MIALNLFRFLNIILLITINQLLLADDKTNNKKELAIHHFMQGEFLLNQGNYALATPFPLGTPFTISTRVKWDIMLPFNYIVELRDNNGSTDGINVIRIGPWQGNQLHYGQRIGTSWSTLETTMTLNTNTWYNIIKYLPHSDYRFV